MPEPGKRENSDVARDLSALLADAALTSGETRKALAERAAINKDGLRRILAGTRSPTVGEALDILDACGLAPRAALILVLAGHAAHAAEWQRTNVAQFLDAFVAALPAALGEILGDRIHDVKPRWAKGAAHRCARILADHVEQLERQDAYSFNY